MKGIYAADASILIELLLLTDLGKELQKNLLQDEVVLYTTQYAILETKYILCRNINWQEADGKVEKLLASNYVQVLDNNEIHDHGAKYKCERSISLPDSLVLGLAKYLDITALFAHEERELKETGDKKEFDIDIEFLREK